MHPPPFPVVSITTYIHLMPFIFLKNQVIFQKCHIYSKRYVYFRMQYSNTSFEDNVMLKDVKCNIYDGYTYFFSDNLLQQNHLK